jgi:3-hydroxybutyryl-CoA dehydrogenase
MIPAKDVERPCNESGWNTKREMVMNAESVKRVFVVGAGVMGSSIAQVFATGDLDVTLVDVDEKALSRAMGLMESSLNTLADVGVIPRDRIPRILSRVQPSQEWRDVNRADFAIEVVPEVPDIKKAILQRLGEACAPEAIIASNTSTLDIFSLVEPRSPERLVIAHFFAPAHIIPLVEVVPGPRTSPESVSITAALMQRLGKVPVVMKKFGPAFIVNRIQRALGDTAFELIEKGLAGPEEIDLAIKLSLGIRLPIVGVVQSLDFNGLDMILYAMRNYGNINSLVEEKVRQGHLGVKTSKGIYDYQGRTEAEILKKRDKLYLKMLEYLREIHAFDPV